jgi:hypothetical protein
MLLVPCRFLIHSDQDITAGEPRIFGSDDLRFRTNRAESRGRCEG